MSRLRVLARIEAIKLRRSRSLLVVLGVFALINFLFTMGQVQAAESSGFTLALPDAWNSLLEMPFGLGPIMAGVLMILLLAPEFTAKTARQSVIDGLGKNEFLLGKCLVLAAIVPIIFLIPILIGGGGVLLGPDESSSPLVTSENLTHMAAYATCLLLYASAAMLISVLVRASGPAIGIFAIYWILESIVAGAIRRLWEGSERVLSFLPGATNRTLQQDALHYEAIRQGTNERRAGQGLGPLELPELWVPLAVAGLYIALFVGLSFRFMHRRDL